MFKSTKFTSGILTFLMAASVFSPNALAYKVNDDVAGTVFEEAAAVLGALNIMIGDDTGLFRPDDAVTRAEFSKIAIHISGLEEAAKIAQGISKFPDVSPNHWANGYINVATSQNMIIGDDTGLFRPDDIISYREAVTILVRSLGYEYVANMKGGYPNGFLVVGNDTGITKKTSSKGDAPCLRGTTAQMTFNALEVNLMEPAGYTPGEDITYQVTDKTLLTHKLDAEKSRGVVTATPLTGLKGESSLNKNQVEIDSKIILDPADSTISEYLGYDVTYYTREDEGGNKRVILARKNHNEALSIPSDKLTRELTPTSDSVFYKENEDSREREVSLEKDYSVIYNGKFNKELKNPDTGTLTLLDSDKNGKFDVVFIDEYENYVVDRVLPASKKIYDKNNKPALDLNTDTNKSLTVILTDKNGNSVDFNSIKEFDVLSVYKNEDYVKCVVSTDFVEGKIEETDSSHKRVTIGKKEYKTARELDFDKLTLDFEGIFYLDINGDIAAFDGQYKKGSSYAYLVNAGVDTSLDPTLKIKLFDNKGQLHTLKAASKIKIDDKTGFDPLNAYNELKGEKGITPCIISYQTNSNNEIVLIDRAEDKRDSFPQSFDKDMFALNLTANDTAFNPATNKFTKTKDGKTVLSVGVDESTLIFSVPQGETDPEKMKITDLSALNANAAYNIEVFDMSEDMTAGVIRITNIVNNTELDSPVVIVEKITSAYNKEGEKTHKLYALSDSGRIEIMAKDDSVLEKEQGVMLKSGDIIQLTKNQSGEIDGFTLLLDIDKKDKEFDREYGTDNEMRTLYGKVTKKFPTSINVSVDNSAPVNYSVSDARVYKINTDGQTNKILVTDISDISVWENEGNHVRVFMRIYKDKVSEIVIID